MFNKIILVFACVFFSNNLSAQSADIGWRKVLGVTCYSTVDTCVAHMAGNAFGSSSCSGTDIGFGTDTQAGKNTLALFTTAYATNKSVQVYISGCFTRNPDKSSLIFVKIAG
ncbi:MAG: hypothetical protein EOP04_00735 [Proteobacteria bacterium]|nr:MAG: hypothetical protein EOP04_00735 [Pseudomonadota bacterium]